MTGLCGRNCSACILLNDECKGCSLCEAAICNRNCNNCYAMCLSRPETIQYINSIGGAKLEVKENKLLELPAHIPILPDRFKKRPPYELIPVIGIHAGNMFARNGERVNKSYADAGYTRAINVDERTKAVLQFYVKDRTLEGFWDKRKTMYPVLKAMKFQGIISPNFSVYEDAPRVDHIYNIKRTSIVYNEMIDIGIAAIPDISWYNRHDLDRWSDEINKNNIKAIAFSFQVVDVGLKASNIWKSYILGFRYLCQNIKQDVQIIVCGVVSPFRVLEIYKAAKGQKIHILNQSAYVQSRRAMLSETRQQDTESTFDELFEKNIIYFNTIYTEMTECFKGKRLENIFDTVLKWDKEQIKQFYYAYVSQDAELAEFFNIEKEKLDLAFSIVKRQIIKKKMIV